MMDNDDNGNNDDDDEANMIKDIHGIVNEDINEDDDGDDTIRIKIDCVVETVTYTTVMADSGIVIEEEEFTKDVMFAREEHIVGLNL